MLDRRLGVIPALTRLATVAATSGDAVKAAHSAARPHELIAAASVLTVSVLWWLSRTARLRTLAPLVFAAAVAAIAVMLAVLATAAVGIALFALALTLAVAGLGDALWRSPRHGRRHRVDRWWGDFERDFRAYARQNTRPPRR